MPKFYDPDCILMAGCASRKPFCYLCLLPLCGTILFATCTSHLYKAEHGQVLLNGRVMLCLVIVDVDILFVEPKK